MFNEIPKQRPETALLDTVEFPSDMRHFTLAELETLANELRHFLIYTVGKTGGHFSAGLGVVELTLALHYVFDTPEDLLIWDVGHQTYPHKILTGRRDLMHTLRSQNGIAPFPDRKESPYDSFGVGHSSTSISAALGMSIAGRLKGKKNRVVAIIGDGAMTAGQAFEALNHLAGSQENVLVVLNDNAMSISHNVGGMARYFSALLHQHHSRTDSQLNEAGTPHQDNIRPGGIFEDLGLTYTGPIDGHDLPGLVAQLSEIKDQKGPRLLHVITQKGKGYGPAEKAPDSLHSLTKIEASEDQADKHQNVTHGDTQISYSRVFSEWICDMAEQDQDLIAITPAMREGSGLITFSEKFPHRYLDVAIAEQHAVTLAAGLACGGVKPVVAIYSTFLQRGFDQLLHDVAIQDLDILFAVDRAGLLEDGATHSGVFDIAYLRCVPNMLLMAPADENETRRLLCTGYYYKGPAAVRYPRGKGPGVKIDAELSPVEIGKSRLIREGVKIALLSFGSMLGTARQVAEALDASLLDMRFVKPLDTAAIDAAISKHEFLVTLEEHVIMGGAGSAVNEYLAGERNSAPVLNLGIPDKFMAQGKPEALLTSCGLDADGILRAIATFKAGKSVYRNS